MILDPTRKTKIRAVNKIKSDTHNIRGGKKINRLGFVWFNKIYKIKPAKKVRKLEEGNNCESFRIWSLDSTEFAPLLYRWVSVGPSSSTTVYRPTSIFWFSFSLEFGNVWAGTYFSCQTHSKKLSEIFY